MMIRKDKERAVSPVIGVILMVAITVIIAAVVADFVLDLGGTLGSDADATLTYDQSVSDFTDEEYEVTITATSLDNADYLYVQVPGGDINDFDDLDTTADSDSGEYPDEVDDAGFVSSGDQVSFEGVGEETSIQVIGALDGEENQVQSFEVSDPQGFFD